MKHGAQVKLCSSEGCTNQAGDTVMEDSDQSRFASQRDPNAACHSIERCRRPTKLMMVYHDDLPREHPP